MTDFEGVHPALASGLAKRGYKVLTPVQEAVLAPKLAEADLLVSAQTGSGKTVAFGLALASTLIGEANRLPRADTPLTLVIAPTRELALQVKQELSWLFAPAGGSLASCVGGMDMRDERKALSRGAHIVVGTPGRLCDHIKRGSLDMTGLRAIVLDEADEMLKMGFREELELILGAAPIDRRTLMFSATVPKTIASLAKKYQRNAVRVNTAAEAKQHIDIEYRALTVAPSDQENAIINILRYYDAKNAIVFGDTRVAVNRMTTRFNNRGFSVVSLSGELNQAQRTAALQALRDGRAKVCIATDVAARGLDLPDLELVIHADIPKNREALLHRSGRTGRAGRKGVSALIVPYKRKGRVEGLLKSANIKANWGPPPSMEEVLERDNERLLGDDVLSAPVTDKERTITQRLLEEHSPEQIAAAFIRQYRAGQSAPEELLAAPEHGFDRGRSGERKTAKPRNDFAGGVWFSLTTGRSKKADPRWLLPMLCKSGNVQKRQIGAIRIAEHETFVEIAPDALDRFVQALGPEGRVEKGIIASRIDGPPQTGSKNKSAHKPAQQSSDRDGDAPRKTKKFHKKKLARAEAKRLKAQPKTQKKSKTDTKSKGKPTGPKLKRKPRKTAGK